MTSETPKPFVLEEIAGHEPEGIPITEDQLHHLNEVVDPYVDDLINALEQEKVRRQLADAYMMRTIPETRQK